MHRPKLLLNNELLSNKVTADAFDYFFAPLVGSSLNWYYFDSLGTRTLIAHLTLAYHQKHN